MHALLSALDSPVIFAAAAVLAFVAAGVAGWLGSFAMRLRAQLNEAREELLVRALFYVLFGIDFGDTVPAWASWAAGKAAVLQYLAPMKMGAAHMKAMYAAMASGLDMPLRLAQASHFARAVTCMAQGWGVVLSPTVTCLKRP